MNKPVEVKQVQDNSNKSKMHGPGLMKNRMMGTEQDIIFGWWKGNEWMLDSGELSCCCTYDQLKFWDKETLIKRCEEWKKRS